MKSSRFGALLVAVLMGVTTWHCVGCASDAEASIVMQQNMRMISDFADDNDMSVVVQVASDGRFGFTWDQFLGVNTGLTMNATLTARGDDGPSTAKTVDGKAGNSLPYEETSANTPTAEDAVNPTKQDSNDD